MSPQRSTPDRTDEAWAVLANVLDPEVPALSIVDLGIVRDVVDRGEALEVVLTPTYSGCPATEVIAQGVVDAIAAAGLGPARTTLRRAPAWTTDWISAEGRKKLAEYGIAPPGPAAPEAGTPIRFVARAAAGGRDAARRPASAAGIARSQAFAVDVACPRCASARTERLSAFGSTACKSLWRCLDCREPFEHFKPI